MDELISKNNNKSMPFFALEGAAFAGKTTLLDYLRENHSDQVIVIPEAGEYVGGDHNFPDSAFSDIEQAKASTYFFIEIEKQRCLDAIASHKRTGLPVIFDRSTAISSLLLYLLLAHSEKERAGFYSAVYQHALAAFRHQSAMNNILVPAGLIYLRPADQALFEKRLDRGTKNTVFARWESFVFLDRKYRQLMNAKFAGSRQLSLLSENSPDNLKANAESIINYIRSVGAAFESPDGLFVDFDQELSMNSTETDFIQEEKKYFASGRRAKELMAAARVKINDMN